MHKMKQYKQKWSTKHTTYLIKRDSLRTSTAQISAGKRENRKRLNAI